MLCFPLSIPGAARFNVGATTREERPWHSLTVRDERRRPHHYRPSAPAERTQAGLLDDLVQRAFGGSGQKLLVRAVEAGDLTSDELLAVRKLIDNVRKEQLGER